MRSKHLAGKEGLRVSVFMPDLDETALERHSRYIGTQYDLSLLIKHNGVHKMPGGREEPRICYELYQHDEVTPGGVLIADSCQLPEYYLDDVVTNVDDEVITLVMNDGWEFQIDLKPILAKYLVSTAFDPSTGEMVLYQYEDEEGNDIERGRWLVGSSYSVAPAPTQVLTITPPVGPAYDVDLTGRFGYTYDEPSRTFTITRDGSTHVTFTIPEDAGGSGDPIDPGDTVTFVDNADGSFTITINGVPTTWTAPPPDGGDSVSFVAGANGDYTITVNGTPTTFNTGVSEVEYIGDGLYRAINADGTEVEWFGQYLPGTIFLQDPVIYIRQDTGVAVPPIQDQSDLTVANAFNSFTAVWSFLTTCIVQGQLTIDARGTFDNPQITAVKAGGPTLLTVRGDPADHTQLKFIWGADSDSFKHGFSVGGGQKTVLRNAEITTSVFQSPFSSAIQVSGVGSEVICQGTIGLTIANAAHVDNTNYFFSATNSGRISSESNKGPGNPAVVYQISNPIDCTIRAFAQAPNGVIVFSDAQITMQNDIAVSIAVVFVQRGSYIEFSEGTSQHFETVFSGPGNFIGRAIDITGGGYMLFTRINAVTPSHASVMAYLRANDPVIVLDRISYVVFGSTVRFGTTGTDYS